MIKIENTEVFNFEGAFRGLRNPKNSWHLSDSKYGTIDFSWDDEDLEDVVSSYIPYDLDEDEINEIEEKRQEIRIWLIDNGQVLKDKYIYSYNYLGKKDLELAQRMINGGTDESKFMRQIFVSFDITAPLYYLKEFDTYKIGTVANSCSTMHKLASTPITKECFSWDRYEDMRLIDSTESLDIFFKMHIDNLEQLRKLYLQTNDKRYWRALIQLLPDSWMQKRTITLNYQVLRAIYFARRYHKLDEWHDFCNWIETLPYAKELICYEKKKENKE